MVAALVLFLASAQQATLRGTVISAESREPLGLTIVSLIPNGGKRFTDPSGGFAFAETPPGTYLLSVRQIGYTPLDTQIVIRAGVTKIVAVLRHLAVQLPAITVFGHPTCTRPGPPDREVTPALADVFGQLIENAQRLELLADSYPFRYRLERTFREVNKRGDSLRARVDTIEFDQNETRRRYKPGLVVTPGTGPFSGYKVVTVASLHELADSAFHQNHCFRLAGRDTIEGETLIRIDFEPVERLGSSDIAGSAYLDSITYGLRYTETRLTRPQRSGLDIRALVARTRFRDIAPGVPHQDYVRAVSTLRDSRNASRVETQRLLSVRFRRPLPQ
jgi:hypothetical protein